MVLKRGTIILLNPTEQAFCKYIAQQRWWRNRAAGTRDCKIGDLSDEDIDIQGIGAEMAFAKGVNVYPDFSISPRSSVKHTDHGDCVLATGHRVDCKGTEYTGGRLLAVTWKQYSVHYFALLTGPFPKYTFRGVMQASQLLQSGRLWDSGRAKGYAATQEELEDLETGQMMPLAIAAPAAPAAPVARQMGF